MTDVARVYSYQMLQLACEQALRAGNKEEIKIEGGAEGGRGESRPRPLSPPDPTQPHH